MKNILKKTTIKEQMREKNKIFIISKNIIIVFLIIICIITGLFVTNIFLLNKFIQSKDSILKYIKDETGYQIRYSSFSRNVISSIHIKDVIIENDKQSIDLGSIYLYYSLLNLIIPRKSPISIIKHIRVSNININTSLEELKKLKPEDAEFDLSKLLKLDDHLRLPEILLSIDEFKIIIKLNKNYKTNISTDNLVLNLYKNTIKLNSRIYMDIQSNSNKLFYTFINIDSTITETDYIISTKSNLHLEDIMIKDVSIREQFFYLESVSEQFKFSRIKDFIPIDFTFSGTLDNFQLEYDLDKVKMRNIASKYEKYNFFPSYIDIDGIIKYENGQKKGTLNNYLYFPNLGSLKTSELFSKISINNDIIKLDYLTLYNKNRESSFNISGEINTQNNNMNFYSEMNNFTFNNNIIDSVFKIYNINNQYFFKAESLKLNNNNLGSFNYSLKRNSNYFLISTIEPFLGYNIDGNIKENGDIYLTHRFNNFNITKIIKSYYLKYDSETLLNSTFHTIKRDDDFYIPWSSFLITHNGNNLLENSFSLFNKNISLKNILFRKKQVIERINLFMANDTKSLIFYEKKEQNLTPVSETYFSSNGIFFNIRKELFINYYHKSSVIHAKAQNWNILQTENSSIADFDFIYNIRNTNFSKNIITLKNIKIFPYSRGEVKFSLDYNEDKFLINDFIYTDSSNTIEGKFINSITTTQNELKINGNALFKDNINNESYSLNYSIEPEMIDIKLYITYLDMRKLINLPISGAMNLRLSISGPPSNLSGRLEGDTIKGKLFDNDIKLFFIANKKDNKFTIEKFHFNYENDNFYLNKAQFTMEDNNNNFELAGSLYLDKLSKILKTNFRIQGNIRDNKNIIAEANFSNISLAYLDARKIVNLEKYNGFKLYLEKRQDDFAIFDENKEFINVSYNKTKLNVVLSNKNNKFLTMHSNINNGTLDGNIEINKLKVELFNKIIRPHVALLDGNASGNITIKGTTKKPELYGIINVYDTSVDIPKYVEKPVINAGGTAIFNGSRIIVNNVIGRSQNSLARGNGIINFNGYKFESFTFNLDAEKAEGLYNLGNLSAEGKATLRSLRIEGEPGNFTFIGDILVNEAVINMGSIISVKQTPGKTPINVIFDIEAGNKLIVNHPIITGQIKEHDTFTVKFYGMDKIVTIDGQLSLEKGTINYMNKLFNIEKAIFTFDENDGEINPLVNITSYYNTKDLDREKIKVYLSVNDRIKSFKTNFYTVPSRSELEVNSLLGLSVAQSDSYDTDNTQNIDTLITTTDYLSNALLFSPIENTVRRITNLDTFQFKTSFFSNIFGSNKNMMELLDESSIALGKYIIDGIYLESLMTFNKKNDINNELFYQLPNTDYGLNLQLMVQLELPFISLGYLYKPKDLTNISNADHIISLESGFKF